LGATFNAEVHVEPSFNCWKPAASGYVDGDRDGEGDGVGDTCSKCIDASL